MPADFLFMGGLQQDAGLGDKKGLHSGCRREMERKESAWFKSQHWPDKFHRHRTYPKNTVSISEKIKKFLLNDLRSSRTSSQAHGLWLRSSARQVRAPKHAQQDARCCLQEFSLFDSCDLAKATEARGLTPLFTSKRLRPKLMTIRFPALKVQAPHCHA